MRSCRDFLVMASLLCFVCVGAQAQGPTYNLGRTPTDGEIRAWDIAIGPAGKELPQGSGTAKEGAQIFGRKCAVCHGPNLEGSKAGPRLVGGQGTLATPHAVKTVGSYWPFATTIWDYINRAMPRLQEGSLSADEVYAVTAFLLYKNDIIKEGDVIDSKTLPKVQMPNRNGFVPAPWRDWKPRERNPFGIYYP
jgi:mono/diheme cytochrome c family protein